MESLPETHESTTPLPGYFLSLEIEYVRCFGEKQTVDLSDGAGKPARWTILFGLNGTGKTTILQSLVGFELVNSYGRDGSTKILQMRFFRRDHVKGYLSFCRLRANRLAIWTTGIAVTKAISDAPVRSYNYNFKLSESGVMSGWSWVSGSNRFGPHVCYGYGAGRRVGTTSFDESSSYDPTSNLFSDAVELRDPVAWALRTKYALNKSSDPASRQRFEHMKDLLLGILPEVEGVRLTSSGGTKPIPRVEFKTPIGWIPFRQLGYGHQTLITWVIDLFTRMTERYPGSSNPLSEPAIVLIDEIDLHLHPKWQRKIMRSLSERFTNTQFIATTQSPLIAQAATDANLVALRREGDRVIIDNEVDTIRGWRIDQILTSDLFGLETARPPQIEQLIIQRRQLLTKPRITKVDLQRLKAIEAEIGDMPMGETTQEFQERRYLRKLLERLSTSSGDPG
ncbi:AAA family ATPase [Fimbriiglobus ruber]|nr:ATP-binding protein [Fimbriiglobus ruber]